jgi:ethanolamine utilization cobalamin adenosyltransferase
MDARTLVTEAELREQLRQPSLGARVAVPPGAKLSPAAADFVKQWQLKVVEAAPDVAAGGAPRWDRPGEFPVRLEGEVPTCERCGMAVTSKPSHLTQVDATHFGAKNTPRMRLRGKLDSIHALALLAGARAAEDGDGELACELASVAAYCREVMSAEYLGRPVAPLVLAGRDETALHRATHDPRAVFGIDHLVPAIGDPEALLWLNHLRCAVREAELAALDAFPPEAEITAARASLAHALNRLSSGVYLLALLCAVKTREGQS